MSEEQKCPICGNTELTIISEAKSIQKELRVGCIIGILIFSIIALIGIIMIIFNAIKIQSIMITLKDKINANDEIVTTIGAYIISYTQYEFSQTKIYIGAAFIIFGLIGLLFTLLFNNVDEKYIIEYETKTICTKCGKKKKIKKTQEKSLT